MASLHSTALEVDDELAALTAFGPTNGEVATAAQQDRAIDRPLRTRLGHRP